jgi:hypothetical protein
VLAEMSSDDLAFAIGLIVGFAIGITALVVVLMKILRKKK